MSGNKIVDEAGGEVVLRGLDSVDINEWSARPHGHTWDVNWEQNTVDVMSDWGAKIIRVAIHPKSWRDAEAGEAGVTFKRIDQLITWAAANEMYVYLDFHSIGWPVEIDGEQWYQTNPDIYTTTVAEITSFWDAFSAKYAGNKHVALYELFDEVVFAPGGDHTKSWDQWKDLATSIIDVIRANDPDKPIIVSGLEYSADLDNVSANPVPRDNVVYAVHPYSNAWTTDDYDAKFGDLKATYPVFATEFGDETDSAYWSRLMTYLESKAISWTVWCFSAHYGPTLISSFDEVNGVMVYTPNAAGTWPSASAVTAIITRSAKRLVAKKASRILVASALFWKRRTTRDNSQRLPVAKSNMAPVTVVARKRGKNTQLATVADVQTRIRRRICSVPKWREGIKTPVRA